MSACEPGDDARAVIRRPPVHALYRSHTKGHDQLGAAVGCPHRRLFYGRDWGVPGSSRGPVCSWGRSPLAGHRRLASPRLVRDTAIRKDPDADSTLRSASAESGGRVACLGAHRQVRARGPQRRFHPFLDGSAPFVACDMPDATGATVQIMAALAEHEARRWAAHSPWPRRAGRLAGPAPPIKRGWPLSRTMAIRG